MKSATTKPNSLFYILAQHKRKDRMTREETHLNTATFISAGGETTAALMNGATWSFLPNSSCMTNLNEEIRNAFRTRDEINLHKIKELK